MKTECTIDDDGTKRWYLNGVLHRTDGPAVEYTNGSKKWCKNGKLHRINGPAVEWANGGGKSWWLNGERIEPQVLVKKGYITEEELFLILL